MANHSSDLEPLLAAWGVDYDPTKVIGDLELGLRGAHQRAGAADAPHRHPGAAPRRHGSKGRRSPPRSTRSTSPRPDSLAPRPGATTKFEPLLMSSTSAAPLPAARFTPDDRSGDACATDSSRPASAMRSPRASPGPCPPRIRKGRRPDQKPAAGPPVAHLAKSARAREHRHRRRHRHADGLHVGADAASSSASESSQAFANNGDFVANALDNLSGSRAR